ncbi:MAG: 50S ribosomal protein L11 methyltransferase [Bacteroidaceae bacterium]|nr:50S ribosomal protein L11 methyltransferase [Bacteroidaceae bacterium]
MKYYELSITITPNSEAAGDVLAALLAEAGFETFVPTDSGQKAYIQQSLFEAAAIEDALNTLTSYLPDTSATYTCSEMPDENWNATWEAEHHFEPISLPDGQQVQIIPRQAFGSGEHATTRLMLSLLASFGEPSLQGVDSPSAPLTDCQLAIDAGCGTGVLGIAAMKLGAQLVIAYDIDGWSVRNALDNFALNGLSAREVPSFMQAIPGESPRCFLAEGDARVLSQAPLADLLMANINRNILLSDLPIFAAHLRPGGHLLLSGFFKEDIAPLVERATSLGLHLIRTSADGEWRALELKKED